MKENQRERNSRFMGEVPGRIPGQAAIARLPVHSKLGVRNKTMKTALLLLAAALFSGCASNRHDSMRNQGGAPAANAFESGPRVDPELPYRTGPGLPSNEADYPRREPIKPGE
jgi:hypothetical protein